MSFMSKIFGDPNEKYIKGFGTIIEKVNSFEIEIKELSDEKLKEKTKEFKKRLGNGEVLNDILPESFAVVREAARRTLSQRHFDVQLIGGIALHQGKIAEMRTGEGKTLTATLPSYLNALQEKGVHIVTVNDYLAKRDMVWMGQIYNALGLSVGCITNESGFIYEKGYKGNEKDKERDIVGGFKVIENYLKPVSRKEAYLADITYGTNHEFGFDYLRDNMVQDLSQQVQRGFNFTIVDEVDSILIDEARVPLIISGQAEEATDQYYQFAKMVLPLQIEDLPAQAGDYTTDEKMKTVSFTESGQNKVIKSLGRDPWLENDVVTTHQLESALRAKTLFLKDKNYVEKNGEIIIIDEFTGRMLPGRRWSQGLHQAIEAKEGVRIQAESLTLATITLQNYFRIYKKISGMTGTAITSAEEFDKVYKLDVAVIPTHKPMIRQDLPDKVFKTEEGKFKALIKEIKELYEKGQPVLVGTRSVERNEFLGKLLEVQGIPHQILNAKNHEREGEIIAQAGKVKAVTIATNMAGRGVDIMLGGSAPSKFKVQSSRLRQDFGGQAKFKVGEEDSNVTDDFKNWQSDYEAVKKLGGLHVIGTERHEARRTDNQLRGRAGRQGDAGSSQFFVSLEDDLMRIFGGDKIKSLMTALNVPDDQPIQAGMISGAIESAQAKIEGFNFDARHHLLEYDDVTNKHREVIYKKRREVLEIPAEDLKNKIIETIKIAGFTEEEYNKKEKEVGKENSYHINKLVSLRVLDVLWQDHLSNMEHLRDSVSLRAYGGHDPLVEYKNESRRLFSQLLNEIDSEIANNILKASLQIQGTPAPNAQHPISNTQHLTPNIGRNDPCPCGSGKKFKKCHG